MKLSVFAAFLVFVVVGSTLLMGQPRFPLERRDVRISMINDGNEYENRWFEEGVKKEIEALLNVRYNVTFKEYFSNYDQGVGRSNLDRAFNDGESDIVLAMGMMSSNLLSQRNSFSKPSIATTIIDTSLQNLTVSPTGSSGKENFSFVQMPFSLKRDLKTFHEIYPFKKVAIITENTTQAGMPRLETLFSEFTRDVGSAYQLVQVIPNNPIGTLDLFASDVDAVYVLPLFDSFTESEVGTFFSEMGNRKLLSFVLLGEQMVNAGGMAGYEAQDNISKIQRRLALDVSKIVEGKSASELPVIVESYNERLLINMATARKVGVYPSWDMMAEATLINVNGVETDRVLNIRTVIAEALQSNLSLRAEGYDPLIAEKDEDIARSALWPQLTASSSAVLIDNTRADASFGQTAPLTWSVGGQLSQVLISDPAFANVTIQRLLKESEEYGLKTSQLDVVVTAVQGYLNVLQAKSLLSIQNENVNVTRKNLDISRNKEVVGYSGVTDVYRWESELAQNNIDLNSAQAQVRQAEFNMNQLLNRPLTEAFKTEDVELTDSILMVFDPRLLELVNNPGDLEKFADFLVLEARRSLPELKQIDAGIAAQERLLKSNNRAFYIPSLALTGQTDYTLGKYLQDAGTPEVDVKPTWNLALGLQYPLFQGGERSAQREKTRLSIQQLRDQKLDALNQFELRVRSNMQTAGVSFSRVELSRDAANAAQSNFEIIQDLYRQGLANVTQLIDAQRASLQTEVTASNAIYQFMLDFLNVERSTGSYYFLMTAAERQDFFTRFESLLSTEP